MNNHCTGLQRNTIWQLVPFFFSLGEMARQEEFSSSDLYFGVDWFGPHPDEPVLSPTSVSDLVEQGGALSVLPEEEDFGGSLTNECEEALRQVRETESFAQEQAIQEQAIVLLTDGTFADAASEEEAISHELLPLLQEDEVDVYVVICNDSSEEAEGRAFWEDRTGVMVYDNDKIEDWLPDLTQELMGGFLPMGSRTTPDSVWRSGWLTTSVRTTTPIAIPEVPGDVYRVTAGIVAIPSSEEEPSFGWRQLNGDFNFERLNEWPWPNTYTTYNVPMIPDPPCDPHRELTIRPRVESLGFYWAKFSRFQVSVGITSPISINNEQVDIEFSLEGISSEWAPCYRVEPNALEGEFGDRERSDNGLKTFITWHPSDDSSGEVCAWANILLTHDSDSVHTESFPLRVMLSPLPPDEETEVLAYPYQAGDTQWQAQFRLDFQFQHLPEGEHPDVFLCTLKSQDDIEAANHDQDLRSARGTDDQNCNLECPVPQQPQRTLVGPAVGDLHCYQVSDDDPLPLSHQHHASIRPIDGGYQLIMYKFLWEQTHCGYQTIVFRWPESSDTLETTTIWEYSGDNRWTWQSTGP